MHQSQPSNSVNYNEAPLISASENLPEITPKAVILAVFLVIILAAANAFLGLKVGITVAASIPAAVVSMGVLRLFKRSNVLENNIVQTAASAGEALVGGVAYVLPALIILHFWQNFHYWETVLIALIGGIFGVFFSVPLRRVLLPHKALRFPEGTAIGHVLIASVDSKAGLNLLLKGGLVGGLISLCQTGFHLVSDELEVWRQTASNCVYGMGVGFNPALLAAGYIVGTNIGVSVLIGVIIGWGIGVPVLTHFYGISSNTDAVSAAMDIWHKHIRYIGVGTMMAGGFWTLLTLLRPIAEGLRSSFLSVKNIRASGRASILRTERDIPINYIGWGTLVLLIPLGFLLYHLVTSPTLQIGGGIQISTIIIGLIFVVLGGFIVSAISGYFAGLVGSSSSPGSALSLSGLLVISLILFLLFDPTLHFSTHPDQTLGALALAISITTILGAANIITNETIQDLKAGQMVGATPWKQQTMLIIGVGIAALVVPAILQLLFNAYGIGGVFPHPGMNPAQMLAAPQAGMMATLAQGVFSHNLPWPMIITGVVIAAACIMIDHFLHKNETGMTLPVLAVGFGIYLPLSASTPFVIGGIAYYVINRALRKRVPSKETALPNAQRGMVLACGLVAGAALMGVILAIPFAIKQSSDALNLAPTNFTLIANTLGVIATLSLLFWIYRVVCSKKK
jgi:putative OPT family oligopeptide transporter